MATRPRDRPDAGLDSAAVQLATLWIGASLGPVERACLRSVLRQGHPLALYCYERPSGVPDGVEVRDAADVLPAERIVRHRESGSVSLFSNWFRYELQRRALATWVDADVYLLAPLDARQPYLLGFQERRRVNNGVLRLPPDSPVLAPLVALFTDRVVPPWLGWRERRAARRRLERTGRAGLEDMPWGSAGPHALTALLREHGLLRWALPREVLYPVHYRRAEWVADPRQRLEDHVTPRTVAVHLWNELIKRLKDQPAPAGSFLARLQAEGA